MTGKIQPERRYTASCPVPGPLAEQRLLPPEAWGPAYRRLLDLLA